MPIASPWLFFYDPLTMITLMLAYIVGWIALLVFAAKVAPKAASRLAGRFSLYTSMLLTAALVVVGGALAIYGLYSAAQSFGYQLPLRFMLGFFLVLNMISYIMAPWLINIGYNARPDPELQRIVDRVAAKSGIKPPKAVIVDGPPNAFAYGNILTGRYVAVTRTLYEMLPEDELEAVIGHEIGHHKHRDMVIILLLGLIPSLLYYLGVTMIRLGLLGGLGSRERDERGGGIYLAALGLVGVVLSFIMQVAVLAFSRLREYYADAHGARIAGIKPMQRALTRIHLYYTSTPSRVEVEKSSLRSLFIYALTEAVASPFYRGIWRGYGDIDVVIERIKRSEVDPVQEVLSSHPPIPKRLRFLDQLAVKL